MEAFGHFFVKTKLRVWEIHLKNTQPGLMFLISTPLLNWNLSWILIASWLRADLSFFFSTETLLLSPNKQIFNVQTLSFDKIRTHSFYFYILTAQHFFFANFEIVSFWFSSLKRHSSTQSFPLSELLNKGATSTNAFKIKRWKWSGFLRNF